MGRFGLQNLQDEDDEEDAIQQHSNSGGVVTPIKPPHPPPDEEEEEELPHPCPLLASPRWGKTKFSLRPTPESYNELQQRYFGGNAITTTTLTTATPAVQHFPLINQFWDASTASVQSLKHYRYETENEEKEEEEQTKQDPWLPLPPPQQQQQQQQLSHVEAVNVIGTKLEKVRLASTREVEKASQWKQAYLQKAQAQNQQAMDVLKQHIKQDYAQAKSILAKEKERKEDQERQRQEEQQQQEQAQRQRREEQEQQEQAQRQVAEQQKKQGEAAKEKEQRAKEEEAKKKKAATDYITKAHDLIGKLEKLRESILPFDKNKAVSKRRMNMKKLCRGKVNTISADVSKIQSVAVELIQAVQAEKATDELIKQQVDQQTAGITSDMARGKRYFLDLLASSIMARIQAEGFNGPRGDGFPLAGFCAQVGKDVPEFGTVLCAHIYKSCPIAIPHLARPAKDASEEELMESLGMQRNKKGEFETFDQYLHRIESIISMMGNVMASQPSQHSVFGGHKASIQWLYRFLKILPTDDSELPLLTAPVLNGFLKGAGHMMSNLYPKEFESLLKRIHKDVIPRLDVGPLGKPRAHRFQETLEGGFKGFAKTLPPRALAPLYNTGSGSGPPPLPPPPPVAAAAPSNPFGGGSTGGGTFGGGGGGGGTALTPAPLSAVAVSNNIPQSNNANPFGGGTFGGHQQQQQQRPSSNPFGAEPTAGDNVMGNAMSNAPQPNPFGAPPPTGNIMGNASMANAMTYTMGNAMGNATASSIDPFAAASTPGAVQQPNNPFGNQQQQQQSTPFGGSQQQQATPFGGMQQQTTPFATQQSPFGGGSGLANQQSPFGGGNNSAPFGGTSQQQQLAPFGATQQQQQSTPFGGAQQQSTTPFGGAQQQSTPFGGGGFSNPSPFGGQQQQTTPFGGGGGGFAGGNNGGGNQSNANKPLCKFFAQGRCRYGDKCRFSHDTSSSGGGNGFGGGGRR